MATSTIGATGRNYATITLWEADTDNDLVTAAEGEIGECYDDANFAENVVISGATTNSTYYRELKAAAGEEHVGLRSTAKVTVKPTSSGHAFSIQEKFCRVGAGMMIELGASATSSDECFRLGSSSENARGTRITKAIIWFSGTANTQDGVYGGNWKLGTTAEPIRVHNCFINGFTDRAGIHAQQYNTSATRDHDWEIVNVTITNCRYGIGWRSQRTGSTTQIAVINAVLGDSVTADYSNTGTGDGGSNTTTGSANNFDELGEVPGAASTHSPMVLLTAAAANPSECLITAKYNDPRLIDSADNDVLDLGVGNGSNSKVPTEDYIGNDRGTGTTCDPGCHQVTATSNSGTVDAQAQDATTSIVGVVITLGTVDAQAQNATTVIEGHNLLEGTVDAQAQNATTTIAGVVINLGTVDAQAQNATTTISGGSSTEGTVDAQAQNATASAVGDIEHDGVIDAQAQNATTTIEGNVSGGNDGTVDAQAQNATADIAGIVINLGTVDAQAQDATASIVGLVINIGVVDAQAQDATTTIVADVEHSGTVDAQAQNATTSISGQVGADINGIIDALAQDALVLLAGDVNTQSRDGRSKQWVQTFDSTYTQVRCQVRKDGPATVTIPVDRHSLTLRRIT